MSTKYLIKGKTWLLVFLFVFIGVIDSGAEILFLDGDLS